MFLIVFLSLDILQFCKSDLFLIILLFNLGPKKLLWLKAEVENFGSTKSIKSIIGFISMWIFRKFIIFMCYIIQ